MVPASEWIERYCIDPESVNKDRWDFSAAKRIRLERHQRRIIDHVLTPGEDGRMPYREVVWSQPKKSGKTAIAAFVGAWFADQMEAPNLVLIAANDHEQAKGRIFAAMAPTVYQLCGSFPISPGSRGEVRLRNGTVIRAIPNDYAGEAGANYGLTLWSELWAYTSERAKRLYDELMPVPTRLNSVRWVETYAGFEDESDLLLDLFTRIFKDTSEKELHPLARKVKGLEGLPCYERPDLSLFVFWDHEWRMPWQTIQFRNEMKAFSRIPQTWIRLGENRWQKSQGTFIPSEWFENSIRLKGPSLTPDEPLCFAVDAGISGDHTALVGVRRRTDKTYETGYVESWVPEESPTGTINLSKTVGARVKEFHEKGLIAGKVRYDPYELRDLMNRLADDGVPVEEFSQGDQRVRADTQLYTLYRDGLMMNYEDHALRQHVTGASAKDQGNDKLRIIKGGESNKNKVDLAVAQSMAVYAASEEPAYPATAALKVGLKAGKTRVSAVSLIRGLIDEGDKDDDG